MARPWTPADLATPPLAWFDAAAPETITTSGAAVTSWASRIGSMVLSNTTDARPTLVDNVLNGLPGILFKAGRLFNRSLSIPAGTPLCVFALGNMQTGAGDYQRGVCFSVGTSNDAFNGRTPITTLPAANAPPAGSRTFGYSVFNNTSANTTLDDFHTFEGYTTDGATVIAAADGRPGPAGSASPTYSNTLTSITVSGSPNLDTSAYWPGYWLDIIPIAGTITAADADRLRSFLLWRRGLSARIPADSQYRDAPPMVAGGPTLVAGGATVELTGRRAELLIGHRLPAGSGALELTGQPSRASVGRRMVAGGAGFVLTGETATLHQDRAIRAKDGPIAITGGPAALRQDRRLVAAVGSMIATGNGADLLRGHMLAAHAGNFELSGQEASLRVARRLMAAAGSFTCDGYGAAIVRADRRVLAADRGQFDITGQPVPVYRHMRLLAAPGGFTLTGGQAAVVRTSQLRLVAEPGAFALAGQPAALQTRRRLPASPGDFTLSGSQVGIMRTSQRRLVASAGAFDLRGQAATLLQLRRLLASSGSFALTGGQAAVVRAARYRLVADAGAFQLDGQTTTARAARRLTAGPGTFALAGHALQLRFTRRLVTSAGSFALTLRSATLTIGTGAPIALPVGTAVAIVPAVRRSVAPRRPRRTVVVKRNSSMDLAWGSKGAQSRARRAFDWREWLAGDTIISATVTSVGGPADVQKDAHDATGVTVWISGGTPRSVTRIACTIVTARGETETAYAAIRCE